MRKLMDRVFAMETLDGCGAAAAYMRRWRLLALPQGRRVYLHHFTGDDWSEDMHDHPKAFVSVGLWGSYIEETPYFTRRRTDPNLPTRRRETFRAPWIRRFPPSHVHRLIVPRGAWTLVYTGPRRRPWGFWRDGEWIHWRRYVAFFGGGDC